MVIPEACRVH